MDPCDRTRGRRGLLPAPAAGPGCQVPRLETQPSAAVSSAELQTSGRRMDPVGLFPASVCSRAAVIGRESAERKSLRCGERDKRRTRRQGRDKRHIRSAPSK
ncbi:hypothetical protein ABVT39_015510 [Epinephelus coioides]